MHDAGALTVTQKVHLLLSVVVDVGEHGRHVQVAHFFEGEHPKLLVFVGVETDMAARVLCTFRSAEGMQLKDKGPKA